jgi:hypothetical protein
MLIVILGAGYTQVELVDFGFAGTTNSNLNEVLFKTLRGVRDDDASNDDSVGGDALASVTVAAAAAAVGDDDLDSNDRELFVDTLRRMNTMFEPWQMLTPRARLQLRPRLWQHFRQVLSANDRVRRTLTDQPLQQPSTKLPRTRALSGRTTRRQVRVNPTVLSGYFVAEVVRHELASGSNVDRPTQGVKTSASKVKTAAKAASDQSRPASAKDIKGPADIEKDDWATARALIDTKGGIDQMTVQLLKAVCKGLGITGYTILNRVRCDFARAVLD